MKKIILIICAFGLFQAAGHAQCFPDRHSTNFFDGWVSCEAAPNPNPVRPVSHFILYDFGKTYQLGQMQIWNSNDPAHLGRGLRDVAIDYSLNGDDWTHAGDFTFSMATGLNTYEGEEGPHLEDITARYLLITAINNYGGECYGLGEIKIHAEEVIVSAIEDVASLPCVNFSVYPNPFTDQMTLTIAPGCSGDLRYSIYDGSGKMVSGEVISLVNGQQKNLQVGMDLPAGSYRLYLEYGGKAVQRTLVKMNRS